MAKTTKLILLLLIIVIAENVIGQESASTLDSIKIRLNNQDSDLIKLKKVKISGLLQVQYQKADSTGIATASGDDFGYGIDNRFNLRRGRIKAAYTGDLNESSVQFDITDKGVSLKEAYFNITDPWIKTLTFQAGLFNRTFGFEIPYSSAAIESPERARVIQTIFPGETDLGVSLTVQTQKGKKLHGLKLEMSLVNGTNNKVDFDNYKDFIGHISYSHTFKSKSSFGVGFSYYDGKMGNTSTSYYSWQDTVFIKNSVDTLAGIKRKYFGFDSQISFNVGVGQSTIRVEYLWGQQPGLSSTSKTPLDASKPGPSYLRDFRGGYIIFVQNLGKSKHKIVAKYDWYDANTQISNDELASKTLSGTSTKISKTDIAYKTLGVGWIYAMNDNVKFTAYYEFVKNEATRITGFYKDLKDNVLTLRLQYRF